MSIIKNVVSTLKVTSAKGSEKSCYLEGFIVLKPLGDRVIIEVAKEEEKTVGGIVLASSAKEKPQTGECCGW